MESNNNSLHQHEQQAERGLATSTLELRGTLFSHFPAGGLRGFHPQNHSVSSLRPLVFYFFYCCFYSLFFVSCLSSPFCSFPKHPVTHGSTGPTSVYLCCNTFQGDRFGFLVSSPPPLSLLTNTFLRIPALPLSTPYNRFHYLNITLAALPLHLQPLDYSSANRPRPVTPSVLNSTVRCAFLTGPPALYRQHLFDSSDISTTQTEFRANTLTATLQVWLLTWLPRQTQWQRSNQQRS